MLNINLKKRRYIHSELSIVYMHGGTIWGYNGRYIQCSLVNFVLGYNIHYTVNIVWDTVSTDSYGGTIFPWGGERGCYSLVHNICGVWYSLGYRIHSDNGRFAVQVFGVGLLNPEAMVQVIPISRPPTCTDVFTITTKDHGNYRHPSSDFTTAAMALRAVTWSRAKPEKNHR